MNDGSLHIFAGVPPHSEKNIAELKSMDVDLMTLNAADKHALCETMKGMHSVFVIPTSEPEKVMHGNNYIDACKACNVHFVVLLSMIGADEEKYLFASQFKAMEEHLKKSDIQRACILRSNFYMQNFLFYKNSIKKDSELPLPIDSGKFSPVDVDDVGRTASKCLCDWQSYYGKTFNLTGPESLSGAAMAEQCSKALGRPIKFNNVSPKRAEELLEEANIPKHEIQGLLEFYGLCRADAMNLFSKDINYITKTPPRSLHDFFVVCRDELTAREE